MKIGLFNVLPLITKIRYPRYINLYNAFKLLGHDILFNNFDVDIIFYRMTDPKLDLKFMEYANNMKKPTIYDFYVGLYIKEYLEAAKLATKVITHSKSEALRLGDLISRSDIIPIYCVPDCSTFTPEVPPKIKNSGPIFIYHGSFTYCTQIQLAIRAFIEVLKKYPSALFYLIGYSKRKDIDPESGRINDIGEQCKRLSEGIPQVKYIEPVWIPEIVGYLNSARIYLSSFGGSIKAQCTARSGMFEAMACARTIITSDTLENRNFIENGKTGFLVQPDDFKTIAEVILYILDNKINTGPLARESLIKRDLVASRYIPSLIKLDFLTP
ncbi:MAG: glycosyltransferase family 4 protein [bacterium]|nr:glycosyltransferase family 4 protein [bacterium]